MASSSDPDSPQLALRLWYEINNLAVTYLNFHGVFLTGADRNQWLTLFYMRRHLKPWYFELYFNKTTPRDQYNRNQMKKVEATGRPVMGNYGGYCDYFTPVYTEGKFSGVLIAGPFLKSLPTEEELAGRWMELSDRKPDSMDPDYLSFVRTCLASPVLDPPIIKGCQEYFSIIARHLSADYRDEDLETLDHLRRDLFSKHLPHAWWLDMAVGQDKFYPKPWWWGQLPKWQEEELGLHRIPTTVMVVAYLPSHSSRWTAAEALVRGARLQAEAFRFARELKECIAGPQEDYGALFTFSVAHEAGSTQAKLEIRDLAASIRRRLEAVLKVGIQVGIGASSRGGERLDQSRHQAVTALNLCATLNRDIVFFEDHADSVPEHYSHIQPSLHACLESYLRGSVAQREIARNRYLMAVQHYASERSEVLRAHLLGAVFDFVETIRGRLGDAKGLEIFVGALEQQFQSALTARELRDVFKQALSALADYAARPKTGRRTVDGERISRHIEENFRESLTVDSASKALHISKATLNRICRKRWGMGFNGRLQSVRLEEAKRLLRTTPLTTARVAQECGYNSSGYFFRTFKRGAGLTPDEYRKRRN